MARSRSLARIAARVPAPQVADPLRGLRDFMRTSPWLAIAIAVHVIVGAVFAVVQLSHGNAQAEESAVIVPTIGPRRAEPEPLPVAG